MLQLLLLKVLFEVYSGKAINRSTC